MGRQTYTQKDMIEKREARQVDKYTDKPTMNYKESLREVEDGYSQVLQ